MPEPAGGVAAEGRDSGWRCVLDKGRNVFLGQPIIEENLLEHGQKFIGAGFCKSFTNQTIPKRYTIPFAQHLKCPDSAEAGGVVLDWPRHWRKTRDVDLKQIVESMNSDGAFSDYYKNTLDSIELSERLSAKHEAGEKCPIRSNYEQFSYERGGDIAGYAVAVRRLDPEERGKARERAHLR